MNTFQNCLELNLKESIKNKLVNHKNDAMIHIFHWIIALVYSLINWFKPWKVIRSWKIACEMSEMKLKCLVWSQTDCPFLNPISQSNDLLLQVFSKKRFSWKISYMLYWEKFSNKSMERVLRGELTCPLKMFTHANLICHSNFICRLDFRIKNFMKHDQYKKLFCDSKWRKNFSPGPTIFSPIPVMYLNVYF